MPLREQKTFKSVDGRIRYLYLHLCISKCAVNLVFHYLYIIHLSPVSFSPPIIALDKWMGGRPWGNRPGIGERPELGILLLGQSYVRLCSNVTLHIGGTLLKMFSSEFFLAEHTGA
jgi:hypothetical protein